MEQLYNVVFTGQLNPGVNQDQIAASVSERFGIGLEKAKKLVDAGKEVLLKKGLNKQKAEKYLRVLEDMGLVVRLVSTAPEPPQSGLTLAPMENTNTEDTSPSSPPIEKGESNPYAAPQSDLETRSEEDALTGPKPVPIGHGWGWITGGFQHFRKNPFAWLIAIAIWIVISIVAGLIPFIGSLAVSIFSPAVQAGFMIGAATQEQGDDFRIGHLFAGFSNNLGQLVLVGVLYLVGIFLCIATVAAMAGGMFAMLGGMGGMEQADPEVVAAIMSSPSMWLSMLVGLGLIIPLMMAYWFAPALIALEGMSAFYAMKLSFMGCLKNILPFLLYGIISMILLMLGAIPIGLGLLIVIPVLVGSIYTSFRDIYYD